MRIFIFILRKKNLLINFFLIKYFNRHFKKGENLHSSALLMNKPLRSQAQEIQLQADVPKKKKKITSRINIPQKKRNYSVHQVNHVIYPPFQ